ncbi:DNA repair protein RAD51 homolog 4 isoform X1 [Eublepharis macularius]|uniref:DNA repair protein RAD51 homolog 4 n=1 Tax=Eublepharis macularius TaxID=481883 RepID=A0AA97LJN0_EUBMA|nr:DNA repair protein RAD51 homolog 4 isoform X1 [Eublepharis macularius]XP_054857884.1 DNA repair protein RAD51 homolog 4 isoform X1 [Eublepharis macularius]
MILRVGLCIGLTTEMVQLLKDNGIRTVLDLVSSDLETIARKCSLSYKALVAIRRVLLAQFSSFPVNGADLYEELKSSTAILSTGSKSLDKLLDAGLYTGEVTELTGAPGSGKTQVCLHIAANISESLKQRVLYIDSTGGFTATRLLQLLQRRTENEEEQVEALQRIQVVRVFDAYKVLDVLHEFRSTVAQEVVSASAPVKMVVVDSVSAVIYPLLGSRQPDGMAFMMHVARELKTLAKELGVAVVVTNHVTRDASCGQVKPALGRSWSFVPSTRVLLENNKESCGETSNRRIASLTKSPRQPVGIQVELDFESWEPAEDAC